MLCAHYQNEPVESPLVVNPEDLGKFLRTKKIMEVELGKSPSSQMVNISLGRFVLSFGDVEYPIAASNGKTWEGDFFVAEKWEFPYWRKNEVVYAPSLDNPIGKYMVILASAADLRKIPCSIHAWPLTYEGQGFRSGNYSKGCIRLEREHMANFFNNLELGARVIIRR